ncbi:hypothetical protein [Xanthomonas sacchari]|uniref:hypothetical protein n=1 Tax=Xanthomonas sacchari TaxID=56458 RepID=UPI00225AFA7A|nr:hypothetical protein [Xanthomonas sacchari]UYK73295.1 hypothetical protein NG828_02875 [Xanthomonas sacchari]
MCTTITLRVDAVVARPIRQRQHTRIQHLHESRCIAARRAIHSLDTGRGQHHERRRVHERLVVRIQMVELSRTAGSAGWLYRASSASTVAMRQSILASSACVRMAVAMIHICPLLPGLEAGIGMFTLTPVPDPGSLHHSTTSVYDAKSQLTWLE